MVNRSLDQPTILDLSTAGFGKLALIEALQMHHADLKAVNTKDNPDQVKPSALPAIEVKGDRVHATLQPASWTMIRLRTT